MNDPSRLPEDEISRKDNKPTVKKIDLRFQSSIFCCLLHSIDFLVLHVLHMFSTKNFTK